MSFAKWFKRPTYDHPTDWYPLFALFGACAYESIDWIEQYIDLQGAQKIQFQSINSKHASGNLYEWPEGIIICMKGTDQFSQIVDYATAFSSHDIGWSDSQVIEVAYDYFDGIRLQAQAFFETRKAKPVTIVGHSLGGSMAKLGGSLLVALGCNVKEVICFGAPRFETRSFVAKHTFNCWCVEHSRDAVPYLPPRAMLNICLNQLIKIRALWLPRKYGKHLTFLIPDWDHQAFANFQKVLDWKPEFQEWESGKDYGFWSGDEPETLFGVPNILEGVLAGVAGATTLQGCAAGGQGSILAHSINFYLYLASYYSRKLWRQEPIGMVPGNDMFKAIHPYLWNPPSPIPEPFNVENPPIIVINDKPRDVRRWVFENYGQHALDDFLRRDLHKPGK